MYPYLLEILQLMLSACKPWAKETGSFIRRNSEFENYSFSALNKSNILS